MSNSMKINSENCFSNKGKGPNKKIYILRKGRREGWATFQWNNNRNQLT